MLLSWLMAVCEAAGAADLRLVDAVKLQDERAVQALLQERIDVDAAEADGTTALHWAAYRNNHAMAAQLIRSGANVRASNRYGVQALSIACLNGSALLVDLLLTAGADPNTVSSKGETVLMTAARTGNADVVKRLLDAGADVNAQETWRGQTALMWAAAEGHTKVAEMLVARGASVGTVSKGGFTALLFAAREGRIDSARALLDRGANLNDSLPPPRTSNPEPGSAAVGGLNAFLLAAANAHYELAALLLDRGADPNVSPRGWTALHQLSWVRKAGIAGSNNPAPEGSGTMSSLAFARKLVAKGADVNARVTRRPPAGVTRLNMIGGSPFFLAARTADADYMRLLVELGGDPLLTNADGTTPLMAAAGVGTSAPGEDPGTEPEVREATELALKLGGDLDAVDSNGETAMHGAAAKHVPSVVQFLADSGAKIEIWNRKNKEGYTPLEITQGIQRSMSIIRSAPTEAAIRKVMSRANVAVTPQP
jgi:ankyrin repeat protein